MGGYGPPTTGFSRSLKFIGDRLEQEFGDRIAVKYVWNIMDFGYRADDILWLVEDGILTLGYQSSSYLTDRVPELGFVDLPFLFADTKQARAAMDGALGKRLAQAIERETNFRILGWFENGFRHISNRVRTVRTPADFKGMTIRVLPSKIQARTFELLGADPKIMDLTEAIALITKGGIDAQENPLTNTVTYGVHKFHASTHSATTSTFRGRSSCTGRRSTAGPPISRRQCSARSTTRSRSSATCTSRRRTTRSGDRGAGLRDRRARRRAAQGVRRRGAADPARGARAYGDDMFKLAGTG